MFDSVSFSFPPFSRQFLLQLILLQLFGRFVNHFAFGADSLLFPSFLIRFRSRVTLIVKLMALISPYPASLGICRPLRVGIFLTLAAHVGASLAPAMRCPSFSFSRLGQGVGEAE